MKIYHSLGYSIFVCIFLMACVKDRPHPDPIVFANLQHRGIVILNEGSLGNANAEISYLDFQTAVVSQNLYHQTNQQLLGDVAQCILSLNDGYVISLNNSGKLIFVDSQFKWIRTIAPLMFPRQILQTDAGHIYLSTLYKPYIYVINTQTYSLEKTIVTPYLNTENMLKMGSSVWLCHWDTACHSIYKINTLTHSIVDSIPINGRAPQYICQDKQGMVWVLSGNKYKGKVSMLTRFNPNNKQILNSLSFDSEQDPFRLQINKGGDTLWFLQVNYNGTALHNGLYCMPIEANELPSSPFIPAQTGSYFWSFGIDPTTNHIYLSDPKGFTQNSTISEYNAEGLLLHQYQAGIGANSFIFR
ncbi:MAG: hypothetical protein JNJ58_11010 [Chitinophagaceae bacterium]|nr:hypothetical protein [Chitinophagaceae bacterium]